MYKSTNIILNVEKYKYYDYKTDMYNYVYKVYSIKDTKSY